MYNSIVREYGSVCFACFHLGAPIADGLHGVAAQKVQTDLGDPRVLDSPVECEACVIGRSASKKIFLHRLVSWVNLPGIVNANKVPAYYSRVFLKLWNRFLDVEH